jgi:hypothetical protein
VGELLLPHSFLKNYLNLKMAHLITLTNSETKEDILFNLDTVVSIESDGRDGVTGQGNTIITTRWGRTTVKDSLDQIKDKAQEQTRL